MMYETKYPHSFCYPTCPRQDTHDVKDCDCGGAEKERIYWAALEQNQED